MRTNTIIAATSVLLLGSTLTACAQGPVPPASYAIAAPAGQVVPPAAYPGLAQPGGAPGSLVGAPAAPVPPGAPLPGPQGTPSAVGQVQLYLLNPDGEVDGLLLADGTV